MAFEPWMIPVGYTVMFVLTGLFHVTCYGIVCSMKTTPQHLPPYYVYENDVVLFVMLSLVWPLFWAWVLLYKVPVELFFSLGNFIGDKISQDK